MAMPLSLLLLSLLLIPAFISSSPVQDPELVIQEVQKYDISNRYNVTFTYLLGYKVTMCHMCFCVFFVVVVSGASMHQGEIWVISHVELETPLMTAGDVTPTGRRIGNG